jgi:acetyl esterase/lipase
MQSCTVVFAIAVGCCGPGVAGFEIAGPLPVTQPPVPSHSDVIYGSGLVCPFVPPDMQPMKTCNNQSAANQTGYVVQDLLLDVYEPSPANSGPLPAMVIIHGGAYRTGDKRDPPIVDRATFFASKGLVTFSINYRKQGNNGMVPPNWPRTNPDNMNWIQGTEYPAVRDSKAAVRWVKANAAKYNVDPTKITIFGESAGSLNAMAIALTFEGDYKLELSTKEDPTLNTTNLRETSDAACILDHWGSDDMSTQLTKRDGRERYTAKNAPVAIFHGTSDGEVPYWNALQIDGGYNKTGVAHQLFPLVGQGHGCWNATTIDGRTQDEAGFAFLAKVLAL